MFRLKILTSDNFTSFIARKKLKLNTDRDANGVATQNWSTFFFFFSSIVAIIVGYCIHLKILKAYDNTKN